MSPKKGHFAGDAQGARQYLANAAAAGLWTPQKSLGEYKDGQVLRKANAFKVQEQAECRSVIKPQGGMPIFCPNGLFLRLGNTLVGCHLGRQTEPHQRHWHPNLAKM